MTAEELRARARLLLRTTGLAAHTGATLGLFLARRRVGHHEEDPVLRDRWVRRWSRQLLRLFAIRLTVDGSVPDRGASGRMVISNHRSAIDIGLLLSRFGGRMVSRHDLANWPLIGVGARSIGTVFVDRRSPRSGMVTIRAMRHLLEQGESVSVFPEGTTFAGDDVHPFHPGAFVAAAGTGAPIVPVGLAYASGSQAAFFDETFPEHLRRISRAPPTRVVLAVGEPISTHRARGAQLQEAGRAAVTDLVRRARRLVDAQPPPTK